jgi:FMN-dependent oxidoreductase (nitrilotriacetate monooxygenase family)
MGFEPLSTTFDEASKLVQAGQAPVHGMTLACRILDEAQEKSMFHVGWFAGRGYSVNAWNQPWSGSIGSDWMEPDLFLDLARAMDRACCDYVMIEDGSFIPDAFQGSAEWSLRNAYTVPKCDPMPLVPLLGLATKGLGIVATMTTAFYPPFMAARLGATLDHLTHGRAGLNLVTAHNDRSAQNYGLDRHHEHDLRYEMADEWMEVVDRLWNSWEPGAIVNDSDGGTFADHTKIRPIEFEGRYYKCRGPLNMPPGPQRRPVICQAGGSPAGRTFAAKHADTIVARARTVEACKAYRDDVRTQMVAHGRDPDDCKVMFCIGLVLGETVQEAREKRQRQNAAMVANLQPRLAHMSFLTGKDFSKFDLDAQLPEMKTNGSRSAFEGYTSATGAKTLREMLIDPGSGGIDFTGTPDSVAAELGEVAEQIGGDGFLITETVTRRTISEVTDGLAQALRRRGLMRGSYEHKHFRDNLMAF